MPEVTCPSCGQRGETNLDSAEFEARGQWKGKPVRRCRNCGAGMTIHPSVLLRPKAKLIDAGVWQKMEASWGREFGRRD